MKILKPNLLFIAVSTFMLLAVLPLRANASLMVFQDQVIQVKLGETFTMPASIDPTGEKNYTVRLTLTFSAEVLEVVSFTFDKNWIALSQSGYDLIDNQAGELIKTAGFPAGFSQSVPFGTITFRAKQAGEDVMTVGIKSFILNAKSQSTLESRPQIVVNVTDNAQPQILPPIKPLPDLPVSEQPNLFDVQLGTSSTNLVTRIAPGEQLPIAVKLTNFGSQQRVDVTINYRVLDANNKAVLTGSETVAVETTASFIKLMQIPHDFSSGQYTVETSIAYPGQKVPATSSYQFSVERKFAGIFLSDLTFYGIILLLVGIIFAVISRLIMKKRRIGRFTPHEYPKIPARDRMFYEMISDIIMQMRYRVGDKAVDIANNVEGLIIEQDSGRVLEIKKAPAQIIALLISNYEKSLNQKISFAFGRHDQAIKGRKLIEDKNLVVVRKHKINN